MGAQGKKTAPAGPTRRKVLVTALATAAGVAGARILGLRNLDASESPEVLAHRIGERWHAVTRPASRSPHPGS